MCRLAKLTGTLLGGAVGDALGLPREGLSRRRASRIFGDAPLRHRFLLGRGMASDDTEHACMTAQALLAAGGSADAFVRSLAWKLRFWLLGLPAGVGFGTLRAALKLWAGLPPTRSGVASAGNGPAMRAPIIGACLSAAPDLMRGTVRASTRVTHTDSRAEEGALAVAIAAGYAVARTPDRIDRAECLALVRDEVRGEELLRALAAAERRLARGDPCTAFADDLGQSRGVSGYVNHTVPVCLFSWLRNPADFRAAVEEVILLGGDTDTTGAIVGGLSGATVGEGGIPQEWVRGIFEWPRSVGLMRKLARRLDACFPRGTVADEKDRPGPLGLFWPGILPRNVLFAGVVLLHGLRRLLPPY